MSLERALAPLAVAVGVIVLAVWLMLTNDIALGPWLLALLMVAHGWVHLLWVFPKPQSPDDDFGGRGYPFDFARSWLITRGGLEPSQVRRIGILVMVVTFAFSALAALSTVGLIVPTEWWGGLMLGTAAASTGMLLLFYSPALILGFANNALILALVVSGSWSPA